MNTDDSSEVNELRVKVAWQAQRILEIRQDRDKWKASFQQRDADWQAAKRMCDQLRIDSERLKAERDRLESECKAWEESTRTGHNIQAQAVIDNAALAAQVEQMREALMLASVIVRDATPHPDGGVKIREAVVAGRIERALEATNPADCLIAVIAERMKPLVDALEQISNASPCRVSQMDSTMRVDRFDAYLPSSTVNIARAALAATNPAP